jgi:hypothetical protein
MRSIAERRHELAIRAAIGSSPAQTRRRSFGTQRASQDWGSLRSCRAAAAARGLAHSLFGVRPYDPLTFGGIAIAILVVALLACLIPTQRASRSIQGEANRCEKRRFKGSKVLKVPGSATDRRAPELEPEP